MNDSIKSAVASEIQIKLTKAELVLQNKRRKAKQQKLLGLSASAWIEQTFGVTLWDKQKEILTALEDPDIDIISVRSCNAIGKSFVCSGITIWAPETQGPILTITTAPGDRQVKEIIWREVDKLLAKAKMLGSKLAGERVATRYIVSPDSLSMGFTASKNQDSNQTFQGFHELKMLIVVDEACAIEQQVWDAIISLMAGGKAKLIMIGNPIIAQGYFYESFKRDNVCKIKVDVFDTPNLKSKGITLDDFKTGAWKEKDKKVPDPFPGLVQAAWVAKVFEGGIDSAYARTRCFAEFPRKGDDSLFDLSDIEYCIKQEVETDQYDIEEMAVDVARMGSDDCVIMHRKGFVVRTIAIFSKSKTTDTIAKIKYHFDQHPNVKRIKIDEIGVGGGVVDGCEALGLPVYGMNASASSFDPKKYANKRAEWYCGLAQLIEEQLLDLEKDEDVVKQLLATKWKVVARSGHALIQIEAKDKIKKSLNGLSPDKADTLSMLFGEPVMETQIERVPHDTIFPGIVNTKKIF